MAAGAHAEGIATLVVRSGDVLIDNIGLRPAIFVRVHETKLAAAVEQRLVHNRFLGLGVPDATLANPARGNFIASPSVLRGAELGRYTLHPLSALRGHGVARSAHQN